MKNRQYQHRFIAYAIKHAMRKTTDADTADNSETSGESKWIFRDLLHGQTDFLHKSQSNLWVVTMIPESRFLNIAVN